MAKEGDEKYSLKLLGTGVDIQNPDFLKRLADVALIPVEEVAKLGATAVRVLALPFRAAEAYGERLVQTIKNAEAQVPSERQIEPAPSIVGPILENVKHLEDGNPLLTMYENLLARTMDRDRVNEAHPAFPKIIEQLSPDEARLLVLVRRKPFERRQTARQYRDKLPDGTYFSHEVKTDTLPRGSLFFPQHAWMYIAHLKDLSLLVQPTVEKDKGSDPENRVDEHGAIYTNWELLQEIRLSSLGLVFAKACMPDDWPPFR